MRTPLSEKSIHDYIEKIEPLQRALDLIADHVVITDPNANILYANAVVEKNTGYSLNEISGKNPGDLWGGKMPKEFYEKMWQTIKIDKKPFVGEVKNKKKDGTDYWQEVHITPILNENGEVVFFLAIEPNITDRKEREKFREDFMSIVGHQLQNPLTSIKWTLQWLLERGGLTPDQQTALQELYQQNQGIVALVKDLLILSRVEKGTLQKEPVSLSALIREIYTQAAKRFPGITFTSSLDEIPPADTYANLARNIFENIINNAAEYSDPAHGLVHIALRTEAAAYVFECRDNGIGIEPKDQEHIFQEFFRAKNAEEHKRLGTGLGLFIAKMIAETLGWNITFESTPGAGTAFFVRIPIA